MDYSRTKRRYANIIALCTSVWQIKLNGDFDMEKRMQEILEQQGMPFDYTGDIQTLMEKDDHVLMNATFVFMFGRIIGIREERAKRRGTRA